MTTFKQNQKQFSFWAIALGLVFFASNLFAQSKPFPQNVNYGRGFKATSISTSTIQTNYNNWKSKYLKTCTNNGKRVEFDNPTGTTVSEGQGYGMVMAAYMGDKTTFDQLYTYEKSRHNSYGNMGWKSDCSGFISSVGGSVSATDGDLDIALGLCIASAQWGGNYTQDAKNRINKLKQNNFTYNSGYGKWIQEWRDGTTESYGNSSYWCPGIYRVFKSFTGDADWDSIITNTYDIWYAAANKTTGFCGNEVYGNGSNKQDFVDYNGSRTPWRTIIDYLWTGNSRAETMTDLLTKWANGKGISNVKDGYYIDGRERSSWNQSPAWTGAWACGAMSSSQATLNTFVSHFNTCTYDQYYASSLRILYQLTLTGNYWRPYPPASARKGVEEAGTTEEVNYVSIYPNPSTSVVKLTIPGAGKTTTLQFVDTFGAVALTKVVPVDGATATFDLSTLKPGLYTLKTLRGGKSAQARIIVGDK